MVDHVRVLLVDDEPDVLELTAAYLEREGPFTPVTETNASDGLDRLASESIDCVVSDYQMPVTDGLEFLESVREHHPDCPFVLFTGKGDAGIERRALASGADAYVSKTPVPDQYLELANRIREAVGLPRKELQYRGDQEETCDRD